MPKVETCETSQKRRKTIMAGMAKKFLV